MNIFLDTRNLFYYSKIYDLGIPTGIKNNKNINYDENTNNPNKPYGVQFCFFGMWKS